MAVIAAIDFGTNTFHILIAEVKPNGHFKELDRKRFFVYLDRDASKMIIEPAIIAAKQAIVGIKSMLDNHTCHDIRAVATEVFRKKTNGPDILEMLSQHIETDIKLISGDTEASLSHAAVAYSYPSTEPYLIMDIGGGSTEFIVSNQGKSVWRKSFKLGLSVLTQLVGFTDQLEDQMVDIIDKHYRENLSELKAELTGLNLKTLVINGGAGELLPLAISHTKLVNDCCELDLKAFLALFEELKFSTYAARTKLNWLTEDRIKLFPLFLLNVKLVLNDLNIKNLVYCKATLKEGLIISENIF